MLRKQQNIKSENCIKCDKYIETGEQCGYCQIWFHFKCEGKTKEKVIKECPEEIQCICKKGKVNQEERIRESIYDRRIKERHRKEMCQHKRSI